jgi:hypothetical protein
MEHILIGYTTSLSQNMGKLIKLDNGNFHYTSVPFTEPKEENTSILRKIIKYLSR